MNAYIVKQGDQVIKVRHGAYNKNEDGTPIIEENVKDFEDINKWKKQDYFEELRKEKVHGKEIESDIQQGWNSKDRSPDEKKL